MEWGRNIYYLNQNSPLKYRGFKKGGIMEDTLMDLIEGLADTYEGLGSAEVWEVSDAKTEE